MIKVSFNKLQLCFQDGLSCECLHVYAHRVSEHPIDGIKSIWTSRIEYFTVKETNIKSIEKI